MYSVALLATSSPARFRVKEILQSGHDIRVSVYSQVSDLLRAIKEGQHEVVVLKVTKMNQKHLLGLDSLCKRLGSVKVLMVADLIPNSTRSAYFENNRAQVAILDLRFESFDLARIVRRMAEGSPQIFRRYGRRAVHQRAEVRISPSILGKAASVINLSEGGLCLKYFDGKVRPGEPLALELFGAGDRKFKVTGQVAWVNPRKNLLGLEFRRVSEKRHLELVAN